MAAPATSLRIGISCNFMHADPERALFKGMTLQFIEERMALYVARAGAVPLAVPDLKDDAGAEAVLEVVDGLLLAGGADLCPRTYGEEPLDPKWEGDAIRDAYEIRLVAAARRRGLPIFGICRGFQLLNVALGGTLLQDITTQRDGSLVHRDWHQYDALGHDIRVDPQSWLAQVYGGATTLAVNSVHHQGIHTVAPPLRATAWAPDGIVEAVQMSDMSDAGDVGEWIAAVQWHPEWLEGGGTLHRADGDALMTAFVAECRRRAAAR